MFALFAEEDILNAAGETIVEKDSLIEMAVSDKEGKCTIPKQSASWEILCDGG